MSSSLHNGSCAPYRFPVREYEPGGLSQAHFYRNRYYMPWTGIFMSRDALEEDWHRSWQYVRNQPVMLADPYGLADPVTFVAIFFILGGTVLFSQGCGQGALPPAPPPPMGLIASTSAKWNQQTFKALLLHVTRAVMRYKMQSRLASGP